MSRPRRRARRSGARPIANLSKKADRGTAAATTPSRTAAPAAMTEATDANGDAERAARLARLQQRRTASAPPAKASGSASDEGVGPVPTRSQRPRREHPAAASRATIAGLSASATFLLVAAMTSAGSSKAATASQSIVPEPTVPATPPTIYRIIYRDVPAGSPATPVPTSGPAGGAARLTGPAQPGAARSARPGAGSSAATATSAPAATSRSASPAAGSTTAQPTPTAGPSPTPPPSPAPRPASPPTTSARRTPPTTTSCGSHC